MSIQVAAARRILFLTPQVPYPPEQGTAIRNYNLLTNVAQRHQVALLSFAEADSPDIGPLRALCERVALVRTPSRSQSDRLRTLLSTRQPDMAERLLSETFWAALQDMITSWPCDVVQVEGIELGPYALRLRQWLGERCPAIVFDDHNAEYLMQQRVCAADARQPRRWAAALYSLVQWRRLLRYESQVCRAATAVVCVSDADAAALRRAVPGLEPVVIPNGVDAQRYRAGGEAPLALQHPALLFTGKMDYRPNIDAVVWFANEVLPVVQAVRADATFYIVGKAPHARVQALETLSGVVVTGYVPDVLPYFDSADVYVAPLRVGGGTRLKVLETLAAGLPLVSTRLGVEGIAIEHGRHALLSDTVGGLAEAVLRLIGDADLRARLAENGRDFVSAQYDWERLAPRLDDVYASVACG